MLDIGAGGGAVTAPLARTGALVLAIERDPRFVDRLRARFEGQDRVRVVPGDALTVPLPRRRFDAALTLLRAAHRAPRSPARTVLRQVTGHAHPYRLLVALGIDPPAPAATVPMAAWVELARSFRR